MIEQLYPPVLDELATHAQNGEMAGLASARYVTEVVDRLDGLHDSVHHAYDAGKIALLQAKRDAFSNLDAHGSLDQSLACHPGADDPKKDSKIARSYTYLQSADSELNSEAAAMMQLREALEQTVVSGVGRRLGGVMGAAKEARAALTEANSLAEKWRVIYEKIQEYKQRREEETKTINVATKELSTAEETLNLPETTITDAEPVTAAAIASGLEQQKTRMNKAADDLEALIKKLDGYATNFNKAEEAYSSWAAAAQENTAPPIPGEVTQEHERMRQIFEMFACGMPVTPEGLRQYATTLGNAKESFETVHKQAARAQADGQKASTTLSGIKNWIVQYLTRGN
jgi:chromosome segregation ATPase